MRIIIDRFEKNCVVVELPDKSTWNVPQALFPGAVEGDNYIISKDENETAKCQKRIQNKFDRLKRE